MSDNEKVTAPVHPGVILREEFLIPLGVTEYQLAKAVGAPQTRISAITHGRRRISADTGLRLSCYFGMSEGFWTGLQEDYDRERAMDRLGATLDNVHPIAAASSLQPNVPPTGNAGSNAVRPKKRCKSPADGGAPDGHP